MENKSIISRGFIIVLGVGALITLTIRIVSSLKSDTKIVFCDVGQGDASYIRIHNKIDLLIDAGPDRSVLSCLGKHMPFNDRSIELAIISHPHKDHFYGFLPVLERYSINTLLMTPSVSEDPQFITLLNKLKSKKTRLGYLLEDRIISTDSTTIEVYWPARSYLDSINSSDRFPINNSNIDPNDISLVFSYIEGTNKVLYAGDAPQWALENIMEEENLKSAVLKVPHHGSKTGLNKKILDSVRPSLSIISVGKNNFYHHPSSEILGLFRSEKSKLLRTDENGDVVLRISEGKLYLE